MNRGRCCGSVAPCLKLPCVLFNTFRCDKGMSHVQSLERAKFMVKTVNLEQLEYGPCRGAVGMKDNKGLSYVAHSLFSEYLNSAGDHMSTLLERGAKI